MSGHEALGEESRDARERLPADFVSRLDLQRPIRRIGEALVTRALRQRNPEVARQPRHDLIHQRLRALQLGRPREPHLEHAPPRTGSGTFLDDGPDRLQRQLPVGGRAEERGRNVQLRPVAMEGG